VNYTDLARFLLGARPQRGTDEGLEGGLVKGACNSAGPKLLIEHGSDLLRVIVETIMIIVYDGMGGRGLDWYAEAVCEPVDQELGDGYVIALKDTT